MDAVACGSRSVTKRPERAAQGYRRYHCRTCCKQFNERSATLLNHVHYPSDVIALVMLWRLRYRLTLRGLAEMFLLRKIVFNHEAVRTWEAKLAPALAEELRLRCRGSGRGRRWHVEVIYSKIGGHWAYLYRAIDCDGNLFDTMLSEHRDMAAAQAFFRSAKSVTGVTPDQVTTDGHGSYLRAIRSTLGRDVEHRTSAYKNNRLKQDHRGVKGRTRCMCGARSFISAERFCQSYNEPRNVLRPALATTDTSLFAVVVCFTSAVPVVCSPLSPRHRLNLAVISCCQVGMRFDRTPQAMTQIDRIMLQSDWRSFGRAVEPGRHTVLLLDQAGWHLSANLKMPTNITVLPLPAKCPELNVMENVWQFMRDNCLSNRVFTDDDIVGHCCS